MEAENDDYHKKERATAVIILVFASLAIALFVAFSYYWAYPNKVAKRFKNRTLWPEGVLQDGRKVAIKHGSGWKNRRKNSKWSYKLQRFSEALEHYFVELLCRLHSYLPGRADWVIVQKAAINCLFMSSWRMVVCRSTYIQSKCLPAITNPFIPAFNAVEKRNLSLSWLFDLPYLRGRVH
ncbi:hypothetical protein HAX54_012324 [Datura stramonium]|uniref:Uncharacterized protein n=1 Tax=Datura stramonium TaxID=4076 RepID=A0ABS8Y384_DATST|nr:hypothetical protein [Datura stramonium]